MYWKRSSKTCETALWTIHVTIPYGPLFYLSLSLFRWNYQTEDELDGSGHWGKMTTYGGGGYVQNLALNKADSMAIIDKLMQNLWLDRGTRAVFVDFTVYNANINLFCVIRYAGVTW